MAEGNSLRESLNGSAGRAVTVGFLIVAIVAAGYVAYSYSRPDAATAEAQNPLFVDASTGKPFHAHLTATTTIPVMAPSGKATGYPAELCFWTKDGGVRAEPYPVLLNEYAQKSGPTFCPDCGRLVVHHNPSPSDRAKAPPTEAEYSASAAGR